MKHPRSADRISPVVTLVASLALVAVSFGAWLAADRGGVGLDLPRTTAASSAEAVAPDAAGTPSAPQPDGSDTSPVPARPAPPGAPEIPRVDATEIQAPEQVDPPTWLTIPSVDVAMPIVPTGVLSDGQMELPDNPDRIGWYRFGPTIGADRGSVVLGGHVDSVKYGTGPLARLSSLTPGARIGVTDGEGDLLTYRVTDVERISKSALPTDTLFAPDSKPRLVVITCGGRYLPEAGGYEDNIVVIATPA
ncbi:MAG: class F sortase [Candidatus Nanopelagicales bacterium]